MRGMGGTEAESCPFSFNFEPDSFKPGDTVSYRVNGNLEGFPFVGTLLEVHDDHVVLSPDLNDPSQRYRGTRESRPLIDHSQI